jgi:ABC-type Zn uptake system ZnuABC Zn-binding protein ZnuA
MTSPTPRSLTPTRAAAILLPLLLLGAACSSDGSSSDGSATDVQGKAKDACFAGTPITEGRLRIASTVAPITSILANVVGDAADIIGLVPEGTNSHTFEPPPSVATVLAKANIVFANGLILEEPTKDLAESNQPEGSALCELGTAILPVDQYIYDFSFPKEGGKPNPHLWTDPTLAKQYTELARDVLVRMDPANAATYETNAAAYVVKVDELDAAVRAATDTLAADQRQLLTYHDAYAYFARTYDWTVIGAIQPSSFDEPTPSEVADLIAQVKESKVKAIFGSEVFPSSVLETIGKEAGVQYVDELRDDDLPGEPGEAEHSFLGLMRFNYVTMVEALGGEASALTALDVSDVTTDKAEYPQ